MNILILNGSPKGPNSITLHTALYLKALHPEQNFEILHVGQRIKVFEKDFSEAGKALEIADEPFYYRTVSESYFPGKKPGITRNKRNIYF